MRAPPKTLYWQITGLYLILLFAFLIIAVLIALQEFDGFLGEVEQRLNRDLAQQLARELTPALRPVDQVRLAEVIRHIVNINHSIDIYVLNGDGRVRFSLTGKPALRNQVELSRLRQFLAKDAPLPIRASDPGSASGEKVFSAAVLPINTGVGYLYVVLPGMPFETTAHMVRTSYIVRGAAIVLGSAFLATVAAGLVLFFFLTRRFQRLTLSVKRFQEGAFEERAETQPLDQIGRLAAAFNELASTIQSQFEALKATDEARRTFASHISHDFRTPLTSLRGYADRLSRGRSRLSDEETQLGLQAILSSTTQLEHLADQLAMMVHIDGNGEQNFRLESFSIADLVQDSILKFTPAAEGRGVHLLLDNPGSVPAVLGSIAMIERVLSNLLDNAIRCTEQGGTVRVSMPVKAPGVWVYIEDTGRGIAPDELPKVTQRFYRTRSSRAEGGSGTGLGLAIAVEILTKHGSFLDMRSELGRGTVASFGLRIVDGDGASSSTAVPPVPAHF